MFLARLTRSCLCIIALAGSGCARASTRVSVASPAAGSLVGTWRLVSYVAWDSAGTSQHPFGAPPSGYAAFDDTGHAFIQLMRPTGAPSFGAYYGTYAVDGGAGTLSIRVEGSNVAAYLGTLQVRPFRIERDTLVLGIPHQYEATLVRVAKR